MISETCMKARNFLCNYYIRYYIHYMVSKYHSIDPSCFFPLEAQSEIKNKRKRKKDSHLARVNERNESFRLSFTPLSRLHSHAIP